jgi:DNA helicase II / ATP-dependent DNA helicase PcrA
LNLIRNLYQPSRYQQEIATFIKSGRGNGVVKAGPGSGKTATLEWASGFIPGYARAIYLAYNRAIVTDFDARKPNSGMQVKTTHQLGWINLKSAHKKFSYETFDSEGEKLSKITYLLLPENTKSSTRYVFMQLVKMAKNTLACLRACLRATHRQAPHRQAEIDNRQSLQQMIDDYAVDLDESDEWLLELVPEALKMCRKTFWETGRADFDDLLWLPIAEDLNHRKFDYILVDELQDYNACQFEQARRSLAPGGRFIGIGDEKQAVNYWRGSLPNSMDLAVTHFDAEILPLSVCYRCSVEVVKEAQKIYPEIEIAPGAQQGKVEWLDSVETHNFHRGDMILCRTNQPLIEQAYRMIESGINVQVRGRDIGKNLSRFASRFLDDLPVRGLPDWRDFFARLNSYRDRETKRLRNLSACPAQAGKNNIARLLSLQDRCRVLETVAARCQEPADIPAEFNRLFSDKNGAITLSSVHRAKGTEADRVFILRPDLLPHYRAKTTEQLIQENNLKFVAVTRSKDSLHYIREKE